nr:hypothetical protein CFP56_77580 [Quercus suber]
MREKFITTLGNFPPSQTPRKRRGKSDGECESSSGRCNELCRLIPHIVEHHRPDQGAEHAMEFYGFGFKAEDYGRRSTTTFWVRYQGRGRRKTMYNEFLASA